MRRDAEAELLAVRALRQHREAGEAHVLGHAGFAVLANIEGTQDLAGEVLAGVDRDVMVLVAERPQAFDAQAAAAVLISRLALLVGYLHGPISTSLAGHGHSCAPPGPGRDGHE